MSKILFETRTESKLYNNIDEMLIDLSKQNIFIDSVEDGVIKSGENTFSFNFITLNKKNTKIGVIESSEKTRDELRNAFTLMKTQGYSMPKEEVEKLKKQFAFLPEKTNANK